MTPKIDQETIKEAIRNSFGFWLNQHLFSLGDIFKDSIKEAALEAFSNWLENHSEELIEAIGRNCHLDGLATFEEMKNQLKAAETGGIHGGEN